MGHQSGLTRLWLVGLEHRYEPQQGRIGTSIRATTTYILPGRIETSTRATTTYTPPSRIGTSTRATTALKKRERKEKEKNALSEATNAEAPPCRKSLTSPSRRSGQRRRRRCQPKKGWAFTRHIRHGKLTPITLTTDESKVRARDARRRLQEGNDANGAIDAVPRRDGFSPASSPR